MYSITERPEHLSGADLKDIKTKLYYEQLLEYLAFPMLHCALDLQPHYTTQHLQCGFILTTPAWSFGFRFTKHSH